MPVRFSVLGEAKLIPPLPFVAVSGDGDEDMLKEEEEEELDHTHVSFPFFLSFIISPLHLDDPSS